MENFGIAGVAAITVICYLVGQIIKATKLDPIEALRYQ